MLCRVVCGFAIVLTFVYSSWANESENGSERPNVLLILVDDLKPAFGAYGVSFAQTPNLDRIAQRGIRLERAYCNQAVCAPSRNSLLVGCRSTSLGIYDLATNFRRAVPDAITLPEQFKRSGYLTAGIGKVFHIGHGNTGDDRSWSQPFLPDKVVEYALAESTNGMMTREEALFANLSAKGLPRGPAWEQAEVGDEQYADGRIARAAIEKLREFKKQSQPFFLAVGFTKPHLPFCAPMKYWDLYQEEKFELASSSELPKNAPPLAGKGLVELNQYTPIPDAPPIDEKTSRKLIHGYYASMSYMDSQLGKVMDALDELRLSENTIVIVWGDHGYHLGDHGLWTKHTNYEEANRIPLLIVAPNITKPATSSFSLVETVDLYPTLCELAKIPLPNMSQAFDGESIVSILKEPKTSIRDHAYHCFPRGERLGRAIRTTRYRFVEWKSWREGEGRVEYELYDYDQDPGETENVAEQMPETVKKHLEILAQHPRPIPPRK